MAVQSKHAIVFGTGTTTAIVPEAATTERASPKSLSVTSCRRGLLDYGRQAQKAKLGQQKLYVGQTNRWEPLGQVFASAGVAVRMAEVPAAAARMNTKMMNLFRMDSPQWEIGVGAALGTPDLCECHEGG